MLKDSREGTPPFTFTYLRTSAERDNEILEERTITLVKAIFRPLHPCLTILCRDIHDHTYTITTSEEGTWSTKFIADKWCKFPSAGASK